MGPKNGGKFSLLIRLAHFLRSFTIKSPCFVMQLPCSQPGPPYLSQRCYCPQAGVFIAKRSEEAKNSPPYWTLGRLVDKTTTIHLGLHADSYVLTCSRFGTHWLVSLRRYVEVAGAGDFLIQGDFEKDANGRARGSSFNYIYINNELSCLSFLSKNP